MAEYMDYNDYDYDFKSKKQKRNANIRLVLAILFIVVMVAWMFINYPENVRTNFGPVYSSAHKIGEKVDNKAENEFVLFKNSTKNDEKIKIDDDFKAKYPNIYSLAKMPKLEISKEKVKTFDENGYFVIAFTYEVERQKDSNGNYYDEGKAYIIGTTGVDFYIFKYSTDKEFSIEKPERFSIRFHENQNELFPYIEKVYVKSESFRLNFYSLSLTVKSEKEIGEINTSVNLESAINKSEAENNFFTTQQFIHSSDNQDLIGTAEITEGGMRDDTFIKNRFSLKTPMKKIEIGLNFDDAIYNKFLKYSVSEIENATYTIKVN